MGHPRESLFRSSILSSAPLVSLLPPPLDSPSYFSPPSSPFSLTHIPVFIKSSPTPLDILLYLSSTSDFQPWLHIKRIQEKIRSCLAPAEPYSVSLGSSPGMVGWLVCGFKFPRWLQCASKLENHNLNKPGFSPGKYTSFASFWRLHILPHLSTSRQGRTINCWLFWTLGLLLACLSLEVLDLHTHVSPIPTTLIYLNNFYIHQDSPKTSSPPGSLPWQAGWSKYPVFLLCPVDALS